MPECRTPPQHEDSSPRKKEKTNDGSPKAVVSHDLRGITTLNVKQRSDGDDPDQNQPTMSGGVHAMANGYPAEYIRGMSMSS